MSRLQLMTASEEQQFRKDGYLLVRGAITPPQVDRCLAEVNRLVAQAARGGQAHYERHYHKDSYKVQRVLSLSPAFDFLIDCPAYFGKLVSMIGTHVQLMGTEIFVRGSASETITGFHTDLGSGMQPFTYCDGVPCVEVKAQLFLTDLSRPDSSNFALIPGSHRNRVPDSNLDCMITSLNSRLGPGELPPEAIQILAKPGDVLLFPHCLWHAVAPNHAGVTRYSITFRYGQLALRPLERFDHILTPDRPLSRRQRRLLGDFGEAGSSPYKPLHQEEIILGTEEEQPAGNDPAAPVAVSHAPRATAQA